MSNCRKATRTQFWSANRVTAECGDRSLLSLTANTKHLFWYRLGKGIPKEGGERKATIESFRGLKLLHQILKEAGVFTSKLAQNLAQI